MAPPPGSGTHHQQQRGDGSVELPVAQLATLLIGASANVGSAPSSVAAATAAASVTRAPATATATPSASSSASAGSSPVEAAAGRFRAGIGAFGGLLDELVSTVDKEREELRRQRAQLEADRAALAEESSRVACVLDDMEPVVLNVGGSFFTTTVTTLKNAPCPSLFSAMFSGRHEVRRAADGSVFIDRDGRHFGDVLNFLRDGQLAYPPDGVDFKYLLELRAEAEFYGLVGLMSQIDRYPFNVTRVQRAAALNVEDSWMYEDGQDEVVLAVDRPCQLLGVGLCGTEGSLTVELEVYQVDPEDFSNELATLCTCAQSFTKADGQLLKMMLPAPITLLPSHVYMMSALIKGNESYCCEECLETVVAGGAKVQFLCWESPNGTNEQRGQFPELYMRVLP
uniref:BTB domain-containing protein n=1 Tax=Chlamydomonas euryale TaxID=1486919 RepID=A0A7R9YVE4_9CHLO